MQAPMLGGGDGLTNWGRNSLVSGGVDWQGVGGGVFKVPILTSGGVISTGQPGGIPAVVTQAIVPGGQLVTTPLSQFYVPPVNTNQSPVIPAPINMVNPNTGLPNTPGTARAPAARYLN